MKRILFITISHLNVKILSAIKNTAELSVAICTGITRSILIMLDRDRMLHAESAVDQYDTINELQVLEHISEVRNDALKQGAWNEEHEGKLNYLGTLLCNQHDWEVEQVERYIYEIIETGPAFSVDE